MTVTKELEIAYKKNFYSIAEYFQMEKASAQKHGYNKGDILEMPGANARQHTIAFLAVKPIDIVC